MLRISVASIIAIILAVSCVGTPRPVDSVQPAFDAAAKSLTADNGNKGASNARSDKAATSGVETPKGSAQAAVSKAVAEPPAPIPSEAKPTAQVSGSETVEKDRKTTQEYLANLTYMVYFNEKSGLDSFLAESAVTQANNYLTGQNLKLIKLDQILRNKNDQRAAYEAETGESMDIIQFIAQKQNASIYIELDARTSGSERNGYFYGNADLVANMYEASTAILLGSVTYKALETKSFVSIDDAISGALKSGVWTMMPRIVDQSKQQLAQLVRNGFVYELIVQVTPDSKVMAEFRRNLEKKVRGIEQVSFSPSETRYYVFDFGRQQDVQEAVDSAAAKTPGLEKMYGLYFRGRSITYNTGL